MGGGAEHPSSNVTSLRREEHQSCHSELASYHPAPACHEVRASVVPRRSHCSHSQVDAGVVLLCEAEVEVQVFFTEVRRPLT